MNIEILQNIEGAKKAKGLAVIIDVFRAFSTACYVIGAGAEKIIPIGDTDTALQLKKDNPDFILMGECHGTILTEFDFGNSPSQIHDIDFTEKRLFTLQRKGRHASCTLTMRKKF